MFIKKLKEIKNPAAQAALVSTKRVEITAEDERNIVAIGFSYIKYSCQ